MATRESVRTLDFLKRVVLKIESWGKMDPARLKSAWSKFDNNNEYPPGSAGGLTMFDSSGNRKPPSLEPLKVQRDGGFL